MTLPTGVGDGEEGETQGAGRVTPEEVRHQKDCIRKHLTWNSGLEEQLIINGLLEESQLKEGDPSDDEKTALLVNLLSNENHAEILKTMLHIFRGHGNTFIATKLRLNMPRQRSHDGTTGLSGRDLDSELVVLRRQLHDAERQAKQWRQRAHQLELAQFSQEKERAKTEKSDTEQQTTVELGRLQSEKDVLQSKLKQRDRGLQLWQQKELEYEGKIEYLRERVDEMADMIRTRDTELQKLRSRETTYKEKIDTMKTTVRAITKHRRVLSDTSTKNIVLPEVGQPLKATKTQSTKIIPALLQYDLETMASDGRLLFRPPRAPPSPMLKRVAPAKLPPLGGGRSPRDRSGSRNRSHSLDNSKSRSQVSPRDRSKERDKPPGGGDELDGPLAALNIGGQEHFRCAMNEKWVDRSGGEIRLGDVILHVPPNAVPAPVLITVTQTDYKSTRQRQIEAAGLERFLEAGTQLRLQPHGQTFLRPVYLEMKNAGLESVNQLLVFHKEVDPHQDHPWTDLTSQAAPQVRNNGAILALSSFSIIETMKLLVPVVTLSLATGMAIGIKMQAAALFNNKYCACNFNVYHKETDPYLTVLCGGHDEGSNNNPAMPFSIGSDFRFVGHQSSKFPVCDKENLYFYFNDSPDLAAAFPFDHDISRLKGQIFHVPLPTEHKKGLPKCVFVRRRIANRVAEEDVSVISLSSRKTAKMAEVESESKWESVLRRFRVDLVKNIEVQNIIDLLFQEKVVNASEKEEILAVTTSRGQASKLLDVVVSKGPGAFSVFLKSLDDDYSFLSKELRASYNNNTPNASYASTC